MKLTRREEHLEDDVHVVVLDGPLEVIGQVDALAAVAALVEPAADGKPKGVDALHVPRVGAVVGGEHATRVT